MTELPRDQQPAPWSAGAAGYERAFAPFTGSYADDALDLLDVRAGVHLLDVAAGSGEVTLRAARLGATVLCTDFAPGMVDLVQRRVEEAGISGVETAVMNGQALDLPDDSVGSAISMFGVIFYPDLDAGLAELRRVVRPGGAVGVGVWLLSAFPLLDMVGAAISRVVPDMPPLEGPPWARIGTADGLATALVDTGLTDVSVHPITKTLLMDDPRRFFLDMLEWSPPAQPMVDAFPASMIDAAADAFGAVATQLAAESEGDGIPITALFGVGRPDRQRTATGSGETAAVLLGDLVATSGSVGATRSRTAKVTALAELFSALSPDEIEPAAAALCGAPRQGRIGVGWATSRFDGLAETPSLTITDLDQALTELGATTGPGSQARRRAILDALSARTTPAEADFVRRLLIGELRQGALAGLVLDAVAKGADVPAPAVRRAAMLSGDLPATARIALVDGLDALNEVGLRVGVAVQPMLASPATDVADALSRGTGSGGRSNALCSVEWKLDGARIQAHRSGDVVRLFTRNLNEVTDRLPDVVAALRDLDVSDVILDGEAMGVSEDGLPSAFQDSMSDFGRSTQPAVGALGAVWFDVLHLDGTDLIDLPLADRLDVLAGISDHRGSPLERIPSVRTDDPDVAQAWLDDSLAAGHEGVMVKALDATYAAGRRGSAWRKVKPVHTLDLIVLAVEWGSGRRRGWLSNIHLGALGEDGTPVMVGKTFKGMTDAILEWQTARFLELETHRDDHVVYLRPEQVVEIALDGAQSSTRYPGGVALRFARVRRYRDDKAPDEADSLAAVAALLPRARR